MKVKETIALAVLSLSCFLFLFCCKSAHHHETDSGGNCIINTAGDPRAKGIKMEVYYPCSWVELPKTEAHAGDVCVLGTLHGTDSANAGLFVSVSRLTMSQTAQEQLRTNTYMTDSFKLANGVISSDTIQISGMSGGQLVSEGRSARGVFFYQLIIQFYMRQRFVQFVYSVGALAKNDALSTFNQQKPLFLALARRTKFE